MILSSFWIVTNICILVDIIIQKKRGKSFSEIWENEVSENQNYSIGRFLMKVYYFPTTVIAMVSNIHHAY